VIEQQHGDVRYMQFTHYLQFPELTHGIFTRLGGFSKTPYHSLNASFSSGDILDSVIRNRYLTLQALHIQTYPCATLWQVHGADVATLDAATWDDWRTDWPYRSYRIEQEGAQDITLQWTFKPLRKADAIITKARNVALALSVADCLPVLFYDPVQSVLGMAHAGWRGSARGVVLATVHAMSEQFSCLPHNIYAGIGPSIGLCCYEVSEDVQQLFHGKAQFDEMPTSVQYRNLVRESAVFSTEQRAGHSAKLHLDLWQTNWNQLLMAGLLPEHIELSEICTSCNTDRFFSHRAEHGKTGRFPAILAFRTL